MRDLKYDIQKQLDDMDSEITKLADSINTSSKATYKSLAEIKRSKQKILDEIEREEREDELQKKKSKIQRAIGLIFVLAILIFSLVV